MRSESVHKGRRQQTMKECKTSMIIKSIFFSSRVSLIRPYTIVSTTIATMEFSWREENEIWTTRAFTLCGYEGWKNPDADRILFCSLFLSISLFLAGFHSLALCFPPIDFCRLYNCIRYTSVCACTSSLAHFYSMANDGNRCIETEICYLLLLALRNVSMLNRAPISMAITKVKKGRPWLFDMMYTGINLVGCA